MYNLIRSEFMKLRYNIVLGVTAAAMIFIALWFSGISFGKIPEMLTAKTPQFFTGADMMRGEYVFMRTMGDSSFTAWLSIIFAAVFIGMDFVNRMINQAIFAGNSRLRIFTVKIVEFYAVACLISFFYPLVSCLRYGTAWFGTLHPQDMAYILRCAGLRVLLDMAMMSVGIVTAFAFRDIVRPLAVTLITTVVLSQLLGLRHSLDGMPVIKQLMEMYPAFQFQVVMDKAATSAQIATAVWSAVTMITVTIVASYLFFRKADLS